ncbi:response regulator [Patescibacteria group bacterium]|nr:response regulator [Patescibacteria group bacterium]
MKLNASLFRLIGNYLKVEQSVPAEWTSTILGFLKKNKVTACKYCVEWFFAKPHIYSLFNTRFYLGVSEKKRRENLAKAWVNLLSQVYLESNRGFWSESRTKTKPESTKQDFFPQGFSLKQQIEKAPVEWFKFIKELPNKNYLVMLVEDEPMIKDCQTELLQGVGLAVISLLDPRRQIAIMEESRSSLRLVISGILQPYNDGLEMLEEAKKNKKIAHIPWVVSTNLIPHHFAEEAYHFGATRYIHILAFSEEEWLVEVLKCLQEFVEDLSTKRVKLVFDRDKQEEYLPTKRNKSTMNKLIREYNFDLDKVKATVGERTYFGYCKGLIFNPTNPNVVYLTPEGAREAEETSKQIHKLDSESK